MLKLENWLTGQKSLRMEISGVFLILKKGFVHHRVRYSGQHTYQYSVRFWNYPDNSFVNTLNPFIYVAFKFLILYWNICQLLYYKLIDFVLIYILTTVLLRYIDTHYLKGYTGTLYQCWSSQFTIINWRNKK